MKYSEPHKVRRIAAFATRGIYFLLMGSEVVYVGQGRCVEVRIGAHIAQGKKEFDRFAVLPLPEGDLNAVEVGYILKYLPKYNAQLPTNTQWTAVETARKSFDVPRPSKAEMLDHIASIGAPTITFKGVLMMRRKDVPTR